MNWGFARQRKYRIGKFILRLPHDHALPKYQARFSTYDRFLPILASQLTRQAIVIDVGANVGDTVASMASTNPSLHFLAVEPDPVYSTLLKTNVARMLLAEPNLSIEVVEALVVDDLKIVALEGSRGSRHAVVDDESAEPPLANCSLDELVLRNSPEKVELIKIDTDGFDWSVIDSGREFFSRYQPMLYFECDVSNSPASVASYRASVNGISQNGYVDFHLFDNFGGYLGRLNDPRFLDDLIRYTAAQSLGRISRTFDYLDVLAVSPKYADTATHAVNVFTNGYSS